MPTLKKFFTAIASILFICFIPYYMLSPPAGALPFDDPVGRDLAIGIIVSFVMTGIFWVISDHAGNYYTAVNRGFALSLGVGFILQGCWMFGEKDRFAHHAVIRTNAMITRVSGYKYIDLYYSYSDAAGMQHKGHDDVDMWITGTIPLRSIFFQPGDTVPVNYLTAAPDVSRLIEQNYIETYIAKLFFIVLGTGMLVLSVRFRKPSEASYRKLDEWMERKDKENLHIITLDSSNNKPEQKECDKNE